MSFGGFGVANNNHEASWHDAYVHHLQNAAAHAMGPGGGTGGATGGLQYGQPPGTTGGNSGRGGTGVEAIAFAARTNRWRTSMEGKSPAEKLKIISAISSSAAGSNPDAVRFLTTELISVATGLIPVGTWHLARHPVRLDMLEILESGKRADVTFQVGQEEFPAHRLILESRAPTLAALVEDCASNTPVTIPNVTPFAFRALLRFAYGDEIPEATDRQDDASELLDVADRFGCTRLKIEVESNLVDTGITIETAADLILLADAKNCAYLKEQAINFFLTKKRAVRATSGWTRVTESTDIMSELIDALIEEKDEHAFTPLHEKDYQKMPVSKRWKLDGEGLDVDGSKKVLISRLEENDADDGADDAATSSGDE